MDPTTIAGSILVFLTPYLAEVGKGALGAVGGKIVDKAAKLWKDLTGRLKGDDAKTLRHLEKYPKDEDFQNDFKELLIRAMEADPDLRAQLEAIAKDAKLIGDARNIINSQVINAGDNSTNIMVKGNNNDIDL